jgi:hypothetical protein
VESIARERGAIALRLVNANNVTIGLDLGDRRIAVCVLDAGGEIVAEGMITNSCECIVTLEQRQAGATRVMETRTHSSWVSRLLESLGRRVHARRLTPPP